MQAADAGACVDHNMIIYSPKMLKDEDVFVNEIYVCRAYTYAHAVHPDAILFIITIYFVSRLSQQHIPITYFVENNLKFINSRANKIVVELRLNGIS